MIDLAPLFQLTVHPAELMVRGTVMYWFLFLLLRFVLRRDVGSIGVADVLLIVLIADASQNGMAGDYQSITDGCILVATIGGWNWLLDFAAFRIPALRRLLEAKPMRLVTDGKMEFRNLRREMITRDELMAKLREHGLERLEQVKFATLEANGEISIIKREDDEGTAEAPPRRRKVPI